MRSHRHNPDIFVPVDCFHERLRKAKCCSFNLADEYVKLANKGRNTDNLFNSLMMVNAYMTALENYACALEKKLHLHHICLNGWQVEKIFDQISILCGGCSCNCND